MRAKEITFIINLWITKTVYSFLLLASCILCLYFRALQSEYSRLKEIRTNGSENGSQCNGTDGVRDAELIAEAKILRQHKGKLEARMQILEDHNRQLEAQLQRLRQLLEQVSFLFIYLFIFY